MNKVPFTIDKTAKLPDAIEKVNKLVQDIYSKATMVEPLSKSLSSGKTGIIHVGITNANDGVVSELGIVVAQGLVLIDQASKVQLVLSITGAPDIEDLMYRARIRVKDSEAWEEKTSSTYYITFQPLPCKTTYEYQARVESSIEASEWTDIREITTLRDTVAPTTPTGLRAYESLTGGAAIWNANTEPDMDLYLVYWGVTSVFASATFFWYTPTPYQTFTQAQLTPQKYVWVAAVDVEGNRSSFAGPILIGTGIATGMIAEGAGKWSDLEAWNNMLLPTQRFTLEHFWDGWRKMRIYPSTEVTSVQAIAVGEDFIFAALPVESTLQEVASSFLVTFTGTYTRNGGVATTATMSYEIVGVRTDSSTTTSTITRTVRCPADAESTDGNGIPFALDCHFTKGAGEPFATFYVHITNNAALGTFYVNNISGKAILLR